MSKRCEKSQWDECVHENQCVSLCVWFVCVLLCSRGVCCFFARHSPPGLLTRSTARTLADGECWQGLGPRCRAPAASRQSSTWPQGGFLGHTHLTQGVGRQVNLKHTAWALINTCRHTLITTHVDTGSPDCEVAKTCSDIIHFGPGVTFLGQRL